MNPIFISSIIGLGLLGLTFGAILAIASKKFAVEVDPRIEKITEALPAANCGGCGFPGCAGYAEAIVMNNESTTLCSPGGKDTVEEIANILGIEAEEMIPQIAVVRCGGTHEAAKAKLVEDGKTEKENTLAMIEDKGLTIIHLKPEAIAEFRAVAEKFNQKYLTDLWGADILKRVIELGEQ